MMVSTFILILDLSRLITVVDGTGRQSPGRKLGSVEHPQDLIWLMGVK